MTNYKFTIKKRFYDYVEQEFWEPRTIHPTGILLEEQGHFEIFSRTVYITIQQAKLLSETMPEYFSLEEVKPKLKRFSAKKYWYCCFNWGLWDNKWTIDDYENYDNDCYNSYNYFPNEKQAEEALEDIFKVYPYPQWQEKLIEFHKRKGNLEC